MAYCGWFSQNELQRTYHEEWGTPLKDDKLQFEYISMEVMQCGLSFGIVLKKRQILRKCFDNFDFDKVALYNDDDVQRIMNTQGMIKAERKIRAIINNAKAMQKIRNEFGSFSTYIWSFSNGKMILYEGHETGLIPASNALSEKISADLKKRSFKFMGPIVIYSHLQACGIINDHDAACPKRKFLIEHFPSIKLPRENEQGVKQF